MHRLSLAILSWTECLHRVVSKTGVDTTMDDTPTSETVQHDLGGSPKLDVRAIMEIMFGGLINGWGSLNTFHRDLVNFSHQFESRFFIAS